MEKLIGKRDYREFLNSRNDLYRSMGMKSNPPPRRQAIELMSKNPNLIRRPIILVGSTVAVGFDEKAIDNLV